MDPTQHWIVTLSNNGEQALSSLVVPLQSSGFHVEQVLTELNAVIGTASEAVAAAARLIPGVLDISPDAPIQLPAPDAPSTW